MLSLANGHIHPCRFALDIHITELKVNMAVGQKPWFWDLAVLGNNPRLR